MRQIPGCTAQTHLPEEKEKSSGKTIYLLFLITTYETSLFWELAEYVSESYVKENQRGRHINGPECKRMLVSEKRRPEISELIVN